MSIQKCFKRCGIGASDASNMEVNEDEDEELDSACKDAIQISLSKRVAVDSGIALCVLCIYTGDSGFKKSNIIIIIIILI